MNCAMRYFLGGREEKDISKISKAKYISIDIH
jgi:hypothetical protein